MLRGFFKM